MKIVLSDMDGTLLNEHKCLPDDFEEVVLKLKEKGILFGIASGRQYYRLKKQMGSLADDMIIIAENGAMVFDKGKCISYDPLQKEDILKASEIIKGYPEIGVVYAGLKGSYVHPSIPLVALENTKIYSENVFFFDDLNTLLKEDEIIKIAFYVADESVREKVSLFDSLKERVSVTVSGNTWIDINALGTHKGKAIQTLKERYHLKAEDFVAFGDYDNDIEMLKEVYYSYAMENATPRVKEVANFHCGYHYDNAVMKTVRELFLKG